MRKTVLIVAATAIVGGYSFVNAQSAQTPGAASTPGVGDFQESKAVIQANYNELFQALPQDIQARIKSAASTIENLRMMAPQETRDYVTTETEKSELSIKSTISQLALSETVKAQVDDARQEACQRINERMNEFKARRATRR